MKTDKEIEAAMIAIANACVDRGIEFVAAANLTDENFSVICGKRVMCRGLAMHINQHVSEDENGLLNGE